MSFNVTNPADKKRIKDALFEISGSFARMEAERELIRDIVKDLADDFELSKKQEIGRAHV